MEEACVISNGFPHQSQKLHKINSSDKNFSVSNAYMNQQRFIHCTLMQKKVSHKKTRRLFRRTNNCGWRKSATLIKGVTNDDATVFCIF